MNNNQIGIKRKNYDDDYHFIKQESGIDNYGLVQSNILQHVPNNFNIIENSINFSAIGNHHFGNGIELDTTQQLPTHAEFAYEQQLKYNAEKLNKIRSLTLPELAKKCKKFEQQERDRKRQAHVYKQYLQSQADTEYRSEVKSINEEFVRKLTEFKEKALRDLENEVTEINQELEVNENDENVEEFSDKEDGILEVKPEQQIMKPENDDETRTPAGVTLKSSNLGTVNKSIASKPFSTKPSSTKTNNNINSNIKPSTKSKNSCNSLSSPKKNQEESPSQIFGVTEFFEYMDMPAQRRLRNREKLPPGAYTGEMISNSHQKPKNDDDDSDEECLTVGSKNEIKLSGNSTDKVSTQGSNEEKKRNVGPTAVLASDGSAMYLQGQEKVETKLSKNEINADFKALLGL